MLHAGFWLETLDYRPPQSYILFCFTLFTEVMQSEKEDENCSLDHGIMLHLLQLSIFEREKILSFRFTSSKSVNTISQLINL